MMFSLWNCMFKGARGDIWPPPSGETGTDDPAKRLVIPPSLLGAIRLVGTLS